MAEDIILRTDGLTMELNGFVAVKDVDLAVRRGTVHALIGPNGAGKTTVLDMMSKVLTPTAGRIVYNGRDITKMKAAEVARLGLVRAFQDVSLVGHHTVLENVRGALKRAPGRGFRFWRPQRRPAALDDRALEILEQVGLADDRECPAGALAYGRRRTLEIATTLALDPDVILLDEPMAGMAEADGKRTVELIREAAAGRTVVMVEHNLPAVASLAETVTVLARGRVLVEGGYDEVARHPQVMEAYTGTCPG